MRKFFYLITAFLLLEFWVDAQTTQTPFSFGVKIFGKGQPMILIPGLKGDGPATYATTIKHYEDHYKCYVITLAGFAGQPASKRDSGLLKGQRDELIRYVKEQHLNKPVLVGFSFGAVLALWMESTAPDLFGKVIDIDGVPFDAALEEPDINIDSLQQATKKSYQKVLLISNERIVHFDSVRHTEKDKKEAFEELKNLITDTTKIPQVIEWDIVSDIKATALMSLEMDTLDLRNAVANIKSPILVLGSWEGYDIIKSKEEAEKDYSFEFKKAKQCKIIFSEHGKHFLMWDDYDWYINAIDDFLAK
jgi:pimeloyl-ACP methyl ester carboxylesterase